MSEGEVPLQRSASVELTEGEIPTASPVRLPGPLYVVSKRALDVMVSTALLLLLAPAWVLIAIAIKLDSRGPVLFSQNAIGLASRQFRMHKFRSMHPGAQRDDHRAYLARNVRESTPVGCDRNGNPIFKTAMLDHTRITRVGKILRRTSVDEFPQLWSVLLGDMSLVGPRPSLPSEVELYDRWQFERLMVKPGMTGLYQVTVRNRVAVSDMIRMDIAYVRQCSFWLDMKLLAKTPLAMFTGM